MLNPLYFLNMTVIRYVKRRGGEQRSTPICENVCHAAYSDRDLHIMDNTVDVKSTNFASSSHVPPLSVHFYFTLFQMYVGFKLSCGEYRVIQIVKLSIRSDHVPSTLKLWTNQIRIFLFTRESLQQTLFLLFPLIENIKEKTIANRNVAIDTSHGVTTYSILVKFKWKIVLRKYNWNVSFFHQRKDENDFSKKIEDTRFRIREGGQENLSSPWIIFKNNDNWDGEGAVFTPLMFLDEISSRISPPPPPTGHRSEKKGISFFSRFHATVGNKARGIIGSSGC